MKLPPDWPVATPHQPLLIAHRGLPRRFPENSASALVAAAEAGARAVELDVRPTADGALVVLHDEGPERVTGVAGRASSLSSAELLGQRFLQRPAEGPVLLESVLDPLTSISPQLWVDVEIKDDPGASAADLAARVGEAWRRVGRPSRVVLTSTSEEILDACQHRLPALPRGLVFGSRDGRHPLKVLRAVGGILVVAQHGRLDEDWVGEAESEGYPLWAYTVHDAEEARALVARSVGVVTDDLPGLRSRFAQVL